jgi:hypothetical protein
LAETTRRYERIDIELPCRLFVPGEGDLRFQAFARSRNLGLGGVFVASTFLLPEGLELYAELKLPSGPLAVRSRISHAVALGDAVRETGMGIEFLEVDARGRETLLRYFAPLRYRQFHASMAEEFPHLRKDLPLEEVSLVLNLWEEWKIRAEGGPSATRSGSPPAPERGRGGARRRGRGAPS